MSINTKVCYLYSKESQELVTKLQETNADKDIVYQLFSTQDVFPALNYDEISHLVVTGSLAEIKVVLAIAQSQDISVGIVPLPSQSNIIKILELPKKAQEAFELALIPSEEKIDTLHCNDTLVLNDIRIGDASILKEYEYHYAKYSLLKRLKLLLQSIRQRSLLKHQRFTIKTQKEKELTLSAIGMIGLGQQNHSWVSKLLQKDLSAIDGQNVLVLLAPTSLFQYFIFSPLKLFLHRYNNSRIPSSCGYIKSKRVEIKSKEPIKVVVDDIKNMKTPVVIETREDSLALSVGEGFWAKQCSIKSNRNRQKLDNIPKDDESMTYLGRGLPLFAHASKEQYTTLFSTLRSEGNLNTSFVTLLILATIIATFGLFINSSSVIIGAMILAPLMQPIVSLSMGVLRRDHSLTKHGIKTIFIGIVLTLMTAMFIAYFTPIREMSTEMMARLSPTLLDMMVAIFSGVAAAYAKNDSKISASLAGVAIAVALVPPLAVSGVGIGWGNFTMFINAMLLFSTNLIGIVLAAALTFLVLGYAPIHVARRGILLWSFITLLIAIPLYHSFQSMKERANINQVLVNMKFDINGKSVHLNKVKYQPQGDTAELRCEVIIEEKLSKEDRIYLKKVISAVTEKPTEVIATFRYRL